MFDGSKHLVFITMRCLVLFAVVCFVLFIQGQGQHVDPASYLVWNEVSEILTSATEPVTIPWCIAKCDAAFALDYLPSEKLTDRDCASECESQINGPGDLPTAR
ncbi:uncharacterized protein LOC112557683 [Pomacea canaliculata]|uniref:uncharacterized protein LOC112557683 n=1 Tax=Pomacea canaliculata TaxID=400727 RepID=UPI000D72F039|nr:uncharacterized protein LOC112557683 [Pomacea canaliculata]